MTPTEQEPDATCLARVHAAAYRLDRPWSMREFETLTTSPHVMAFGDNRAILLARIIADEAEVLTIATHPDHRRHGLARALLARFHAAAQAKGAVSAFLEVAADNSCALTLYLSAGYLQVGQRRSYYDRADGPAADALILRRALT